MSEIGRAIHPTHRWAALAKPRQFPAECDARFGHAIALDQSRFASFRFQSGKSTGGSSPMVPVTKTRSPGFAPLRRLPCPGHLSECRHRNAEWSGGRRDVAAKKRDAERLLIVFEPDAKARNHAARCLTQCELRR